MILNGLLDIYESWEEQLKQRDEPYSLKIWLYEPWFSRSQVICAVGDIANTHYTDGHYKPERAQVVNPQSYGRLAERMSQYNWVFMLHEFYYLDTEIDDPSSYGSQAEYEDEKRWLEKMLKKPHRTEKLDPSRFQAKEIYAFREGTIWVGEKKK